MIKINKKETILSIVALLFIVLVVIGITYAAFNYTGLGTKSNKVTTSTITMNYNEATNGITLTDAFPISDNDGKQLTGEGNTFNFTVTVTTGNNTAVGYEVSAVKDNASTLDNNDVRIYLEKSSSGAEGTYSSVLEPTGFSGVNATTEIGTPAGEMLLHSDSTTSTRTDYYILRMWVAEDYLVTGESKFFTIKVNVYGTDSHINVSSISLNKNSMTLDEGESEQLSATVLPDYATNKTVTWESSNTDVAVVDSSGNVTTQSISGTTTITATTNSGNNITDSLTLTVIPGEPQPLIPVMTSNTTPKGIVYANKIRNGDPYTAFNGDRNNRWSLCVPGYIQYTFENTVNISMIEYALAGSETCNPYSTNLTFSYSTDENDFTNIETTTLCQSNILHQINNLNLKNVKVLRCTINSSNNPDSCGSVAGMSYIQAYGY